MRIHLITIGQHMPKWITMGYQDYTKRLPKQCQLHLIELPAMKRYKPSNPSIKRLLEYETQQILNAIPKNTHIIALDIHGQAWDSLTLAHRLSNWLAAGRDISLLVGGPDGLSEDCYATAQERWSLSPLTLPHPLVRVIIAEQIYRAYSILHHHPYHR